SMFFMLCNISESRINTYLSQKKNSSQKFKKIKEKKIFISISDIEVISKLDEKSAKKKILNSLINYYTASELTKIGPKGLKKK
ncbi:replication protein RepA, partial [Escherichia coli]|nr:replication protein RepA [Escherichia coli]